MKIFNLSWDKVIFRYYTMMAVILVSFYAGVPYLAFLSVPIFLSAILGISKSKAKKHKNVDNVRSHNAIETYPPRTERNPTAGRLVY